MYALTRTLFVPLLEKALRYVYNTMIVYMYTGLLGMISILGYELAVLYSVRTRMHV